jgi:hypothetical protein
MKNDIILNEINIREKIYFIRGMYVMLDNDLAQIYEVQTGVLNQAVKRNQERFPGYFMFPLTKKEILKSQIVISSWGGRRKPVYAFTEQGVAMLSAVLRSKTAIRVSIKIMNAFVAMRKFISANADVFHRLEKVEIKQIEHDKKFDEIFDIIQSKELIPSKGIFYDGQVFDAYKFVSDIIKSAEKSIILIDNYIDESVLILFSKRKKDVSVTILTKNITNEISLDLAKFNSQYQRITLKEFSKAHDRFLIIDDKTVYHFGASLKDLGKKWFAFTRFDKDAVRMIEKLDID